MKHVDGRTLRAEKKRAATRETLLTTARSLFSQRGYDDVSIDDVIEAAGVSRATFYLHFDTKLGVVAALLDSLLEGLRAAITPVDVSKPHEGQLRGNFERVIDVLAAHQDVAALLLTTTAPELRERMEEFNLHALRMIRRALGAGQRMGLLGEIDPDLAAVVAYGAIRETVLRRLLGLGPSRRKALADELLNTLLLGILRR